MSYILDALKRADAQRARGSVPGLNAQPLAKPHAHQHEASRKSGLWLGLALMLALLAALGWWLFAPAKQPANIATASPPLAAMPPAKAGPLVVPPSVEPAQPTKPSVQTGGAIPSTVAAVPRVAASNAPMPATPATSSAAVPPASGASPASAPPSSTAPAAPQPPARTPSDPRIYAINDLPEEIRRNLPKTAVNGHVYSTNPAQRMLIVNGQVFTEGSSVAPDLTLETIGPSSAVLRHRGYRYALPY